MKPEAPWVIVAGGFHQQGGMDKANSALADYLTVANIPVHLVTHSTDDKYQDHPLVSVHRVPRPGGSFFLGESRLAAAGSAVARTVRGAHGRVRVVVNGGNCDWADVNWVHSVHHAWPCVDAGAPLWFKAKNRFVKAVVRRRERHAIRRASTVIANSDRTRRDVIDRVGVDPFRVKRVYLGADVTWQEPTAMESERARQWLAVPHGRPIVAFVGALSHDDNKGLGTLFQAWTALNQDGVWDASLVVAGGGNAVDAWRARVVSVGLQDSVHILGHTDRVADLFATADLLVSPVHYEAYGLNVQEGLCRGVPAIISRGAGIAERYPVELDDFLLDDPNDVGALVGRLRLWRTHVQDWRERVQPLSRRLRGYAWADMARDFVTAAGPAEARL